MMPSIGWMFTRHDLGRVRDSAGKLVMEAALETKAETILPFLRSVRGSLHVTLEEGTWAAWLHDLLLPHATRAVVCDPRGNTLLKGNHNDRVDARKPAGDSEGRRPCIRLFFVAICFRLTFISPS
jgi:hypothetical protein